MILREQKQYYKQAVPGTANPARVKLLQSCSLSPVLPQIYVTIGNNSEL